MAAGNGLQRIHLDLPEAYLHFIDEELCKKFGLSRVDLFRAFIEAMKVTWADLLVAPGLWSRTKDSAQLMLSMESERFGAKTHMAHTFYNQSPRKPEW